MTEREDWNAHWMGIAHRKKRRATCLRRQVGAVAVAGNREVSSGYNGSPSGCPHCLDQGCLMRDGHCIRCIHAEMNALLYAGDRPIEIVYVTLQPCWRCLQAMVARGVQAVYYDEPYPDPITEDLLVDYHLPGYMLRWSVPEDER
jgi:dCMP deaminase